MRTSQALTRAISRTVTIAKFTTTRRMKRTDQSWRDEVEIKRLKARGFDCGANSASAVLRECFGHRTVQRTWTSAMLENDTSRSIIPAMM